MRAKAILLGSFVALLSVGGFAQEQTTEEEAAQQKIRRATVDEIVNRGTTPEKRVQPQSARTGRPGVAETAGDVKLPPEAYVERRFKTFKCPAELQFPSGTTFTNQDGLKFVRANANAGGCQADLSPDSDKGGYCLTCGYEASVYIRRSSGLNYKCWVSDSNKDEFTCEYVAPLPPSQTCNFQIKLPVVNLMPYTQHTRGDKELHGYTSGQVILGGFIFLNVDAEIQRGIGPQSNALFLVMSATQSENQGDKTTFKKEPFAIKLQDEHYVNATAAHVANCLASYGTQRPLSINPKGTIQLNSAGHEWQTIDNWRDTSNLIDKAECRFDTKHSDDMKRVGCRKVVFNQDVTARLK